MNLFLVLGSKLTWFSGDRNWLGLCVGVEDDLVFVFGSILTSFMWGIELGLTSVLGSEVTWFCVGDINRLCFGVITEIDMFSVRVQNWPCVCALVESYLFLVCAWKLTCFLWWSIWTWSHCGAPNLTWFQCRSEINLVVVGVVEIDLLLVCWPNKNCFYDKHENRLSFCMGDRNWFDFSVGDQIWLDFGVGVKLVRLLCGRSTLTSFLNASRKSLVFSVSMQIDLYFVWVVQIDLNSVWWIELDFVPV